MRRSFLAGMLCGGVFVASAFGLSALSPSYVGAAAQEAWPWDASLDATAAAPDSHQVLIDNDVVRVLSVQIRPGEKEPAHTHRDASVMFVYQPGRIRYYGPEGDLEFESPEGRRAEGPQEPQWMGPEGLHAVENIDTTTYRAYRVELKGRR